MRGRPLLREEAEVHGNEVQDHVRDGDQDEALERNTGDLLLSPRNYAMFQC